MVRALRLLTLCYLLVGSIGLLLMSKNQGSAPGNELVVDCLSADLEHPGRYTDRQSMVVTVRR